MAQWCFIPQMTQQQQETRLNSPFCQRGVLRYLLLKTAEPTRSIAPNATRRL